MPGTITLTEKKCMACSRTAGKTVILPIERFGTRVNSPDGYADTCRQCITTYQRAYNKKKKQEALVINDKEAKFLQDSMNSHHNPSISNVDTTAEEKNTIDQSLLKATKTFFHFMINLRINEDNYLVLPTEPHTFIPIFFPNTLYAGLELFHSCVNSDDGGYIWRNEKKISHNELAKTYSKLIAKSSMVKAPSMNVIAKDINDIREMIHTFKTEIASLRSLLE